MREIRFRAWHKQYYKMHGWEWVKELDYPFHESSGHIEDRDGPFADSMCIVMQYTGLKDKNGREIYEGDILQDTESKENGIVVFSRAAFQVEFKDELWPFDDLDGIDRYGVVVGNIYENPDLIPKYLP